MKTRYIRILTALAVLILVALAAWAAFSFVVQPSPVVLAGKGKGLGKDQIISGQASTSALSVGKGDVFRFRLEVMYDSNQIAGIDRASLDRTVNFKPFEIRGYQETDAFMDARTRIYRRDYELQFIEGALDQPYQLPTIVVRYQLKNADGFAEKAVVPAPITVGKRVPENVGENQTEVELRPITDKIQDPSRDRLIGVLGGLGALFLIGGVMHLTLRTLPQWREEMKQRRERESGDTLVQAYRALGEQIATKVEPQLVLHQMDYLVRLVLVQKEKTGWLDEPNLTQVSAEIRPALTALFQQCEQSYARNGDRPTDIHPSVEQLDEVLKFYYGAREVEAWKS